MNKNIVIIHYNTPYLTECLVRSINLFVKDAIIYIFDNSDSLPFINNFSNVTILDNTNGQIINFDKWLKKYPNRKKSPGSANKWGSAKHCYSVEKCMEIIKENFILLDSDVLLKKDISNLLKKNIIYAGEIITQPNSSIKRILPFICYINVKMCKRNGIHYFDDAYMHGLANYKKNPSSDKYDTGAGFYINTLNFEHEEIETDEYIKHYGHGSWVKKGEMPKYTDKMWALANKKYWSTEKNKKVVYTCITGDYDTLIEPSFISEGFDYICYTDNNDIKSNIWEIKPLPEETNELSQIKKQRFIKINPHLLFEEYDVSIWVDGNVEIIGDLNEFINSHIKNNCYIYVPEHPSRDCIYEEEKAVLSMKKDIKKNTEQQINRYMLENFPKNNGLLQSNILLREHNNEKCIEIMVSWWEEVKNGSHRDQLSFNYVSWKNPSVKISYMGKNISDSIWFHWNKTHQKHKNQQNLRKSVEQLRIDFENLIKKRKIKTDDIGIYK